MRSYIGYVFFFLSVRTYFARTIIIVPDALVNPAWLLLSTRVFRTCCPLYNALLIECLLYLLSFRFTF
jgi:hypothetical protein